jgi:biopolymer transport protein ExbD
MKTGAKRQSFNEINITPLTDIFLVLLIIMMVVAPMLDSSGLKLSVPSAGPSVDAKEQPKTINLAIAANDTLTLDEKPIEAGNLPNVLRQQFKTHPDGVLISSHPKASHKTLTLLLDATQSAGINKVAVVATNP